MRNLSPAPLGTLLSDLQVADGDSVSEAGSYQTISTTSSISSSSPALINVAEGKDSGVMMTPEGMTYSRYDVPVSRLTPQMVARSNRRSTSPFSTSSLRSDDTDFLLVETELALDPNQSASSDTSTLVEEDMASTAVSLLEATETGISQEDSTRDVDKLDGRSVLPAASVAETQDHSTDDASVIGMTEAPSDMTLRSSEVFGSVEEPYRALPPTEMRIDVTKDYPERLPSKIDHTQAVQAPLVETTAEIAFKGATERAPCPAEVRVATVEEVGSPQYVVKAHRQVTTAQFLQQTRTDRSRREASPPENTSGTISEQEAPSGTIHRLENQMPHSWDTSQSPRSLSVATPGSANQVTMSSAQPHRQSSSTRMGHDRAESEVLKCSP